MTATEPTASQPRGDRPSPAEPGWLRWFRGWRGALIVYLVFAGTYLGTAGGRLRSHSPYNHYVYLADGWLHGRLALPGQPPNENDWAKVDVLKLRDGRELRGIYGSRTGGPVDRFYPAARQARDGARRRHRVAVVDPLRVVPAVPGGADGAVRRHLGAVVQRRALQRAVGRASTRCCCSCCCATCARAALSRRTQVDDLWLTAMFGVGSVYYFCSVVGQVWFTRPDRGRDAVDRLRMGVAGRAAPDAGGAVRRARLRDPSALAGDPAVLLRGRARDRRVGRAADARGPARARARRRCGSRCRSRWSGSSWRCSTSPASAARSSSGTSSSPCSGRSGCSASACSTTTSCRATSPPR